MSLLDTLQTVKFHISSVETSLTELEKGRKAAAPRARKSIQASRQLLSELRKLIKLNVKALPVNKRVKTSHAISKIVCKEAVPEDDKPTDTSPTFQLEVLIPEVEKPKRKCVK